MEKKEKLTPAAAAKKIRHFCAYQERCHWEVENKLKDFGIWGESASEIIAGLIEENYLNEERFALQFAGGKFRMKHWGRTKIKQELKEKRISDFLIKKALRSIDPEDYYNALLKLTEKKWNGFPPKTHPNMMKFKTIAFLLSKGFERDLIEDAIAQNNKLL